jgi:23S rRNA pseudouridine955/2504/2580 synthase
VDGENSGRRLDNFLLSELKGLPRTRVYRMIRKGEVRVNKGRSKPDYRLEEGDVVRLPPVHGLSGDAPLKLAPGRAAWINEHIVYEDPALLVLNKPAGLAVHGGSGVSMGAIEVLRAARPEARSLELVHRLDRETSGLLIVAKKRSALRRLHQAFRDNSVEKTYTALLVGEWSGGRREVDLPLQTEHRQSGERHVRVGADGKSALSVFTPVQRYVGATLVSVRIHTGRTHQIRAHAAAIGYPIAGDDRYGADAWRAEKLDRLFLHAASLAFPHPDDERRISLESPLDPALLRVLERLETKG